MKFCKLEIPTFSNCLKEKNKNFSNRYQEDQPLEFRTASKNGLSRKKKDFRGITTLNYSKSETNI